MKKLFLSSMATAFIVAVAAISFGGGAKADGTVPDFDYAATGTVAIGGSFEEIGSGDNKRDLDSGRLTYSGQFVIPVTGRWNIQLGGEGVTEFDIQTTRRNQFEASGIGFWRDRDVGTLGIEVGLRSEGLSRPDDEFFKIGGLGEYYIDNITVGGTFGAVVPLRPSGKFDTGYYGKAWLNYYFSDQIAVTGFGDAVSFELTNRRASCCVETWRAGGKLRYKTSMPGTQAFVSGAYTEFRWTNQDSRGINAVQVMGGVSINILGGQPEPDSLLDSDRIFGLDTAVYRIGFR